MLHFIIGTMLLMQNPADTLATTRVTVDGLAIRVRSAGLANRAAGQPIVVFESGGASPLETWNPILSRVAAFAPVIAYDRSGTGQTPWDSLPPTPERIVARLNRLLETLKAPPPYLLVGHSWGGALIRYFAGAHPEGIVGMVYIDPTDITQTPADELAVFESIGSNAGARDAIYTTMQGALANAPAAMRAEAEVSLRLLTQELAARKLPPTPPVPAAVIVAGKPPVLPQASLPFDTKKYAEAMTALRATRLREWARAPGEFIVATNSGHFVHVTEPDLVLEAIRRLYPRK